jgi:small subunit ribosomal protein S6e
VSTPSARCTHTRPSPTTAKAACFFQRDARQRLGLCRTDVPAVVASAVALVRAPRFVDAFDRALVGLARRSRGLSVVAARASPRPSDPRETPFFPVALAATATSGTICVFRSPRAHPPTFVSSTNTPADLFFPIPSFVFPNHSRALYDKRISAEVAGEALGEEYKGYIFKIMGGNDKQGFGMKQGVLTASRVFLLMRQNTSGFQGHGRRKGERRRKACRGCIVSPEIAVLNLMIVKQGDGALPGLTDEEKPRMRGPKRASKVRKLFNLTKDDDVRKYVNTYRREFESATGKKKSKAPKIQRLVTANSLQRKRAERSIKKARIATKQAEETEYRKLIAIRVKEAKERRSESLAKRRASSIAKKETA